MAFKTVSEIDEELKARLKLKSGETGLWGDTQRYQLMNMAQREICRLTDCLRATYTYTSVTATKEYAFSLFSAIENIRKIDPDEGVLFNDGTNTLRIPYRSIYWLDKHSTGWRDNTTDGTPTYYYIRQNSILGFNCPTTTSLTMTLNAIIKPTAVSATTDEFFNGTEHLMEDFGEAIVEFCLWRAYRQWGIAYAPLMGDAKANFYALVKQVQWDNRRVPDERNGVAPFIYRRYS